MLYIGTKGKMLQNSTGTRPRLLPVELHNSAGAPPERMPRVPHQAHEMNWVNAIKRHRHDLVSVPYAAHLTEIMLLGVAAHARRHAAAVRRRRDAGHQQRGGQRASSRASIGRDSACREQAAVCLGSVWLVTRLPGKAYT